MATVATARRTQVATPPATDPGHFRAALDRALAAAAADERIGPRLAASHVSLRLRFTDVDLVCDLTSEEDGRNLAWSFARRPPGGEAPRLELELDTTTANLFLQGRESLAVAIAHRRVKVRGGSTAALVHLPATRLLREPYREVVEAGFPDLAAAG
jgi:hypothetical protein